MLRCGLHVGLGLAVSLVVRLALVAVEGWGTRNLTAESPQRLLGLAVQIISLLLIQLSLNCLSKLCIRLSLRLPIIIAAHLGQLIVAPHICGRQWHILGQLLGLHYCWWL